MSYILYSIDPKKIWIIQCEIKAQIEIKNELYYSDR